jgi:hypothetical protein
VYGECGREDDALRVLDNLKNLAKKHYVSPLDQGVVFLGLGRLDEAFALLEKAYVERDPMLVFMKSEPSNDSLRSDSRYKEMLRRIGLED